jgi:uncharacterized membrane protein YbaN (DUF454 family)
VRHDARVSDPARPPLAARRSTTGWRARLRRTPGGGLLLRAVVFVVGLLFVLLGIALIALPGPLTIPPILLGVYVWSTEFSWADRLLERARKSATEAWEQAKRRPVASAAVTLAGLVALGVGVYVVSRYDLLARAQDAVGLG